MSDLERERIEWAQRVSHARRPVVDDDGRLSWGDRLMIAAGGTVMAILVWIVIALVFAAGPSAAR